MTLNAHTNWQSPVHPFCGNPDRGRRETSAAAQLRRAIRHADFSPTQVLLCRQFEEDELDFPAGMLAKSCNAADLTTFVLTSSVLSTEAVLLSAEARRSVWTAPALDDEDEEEDFEDDDLEEDDEEDLEDDEEDFEDENEDDLDEDDDEALEDDEDDEEE